MDNIIVNSALWYAEQSSQFLLNSGANKLLDKGYDYYVKEFIPLGHRLIQNGQIAADAMDGELGVCCKLLADSENRIQFCAGISQNIGRD